MCPASWCVPLYVIIAAVLAYESDEPGSEESVGKIAAILMANVECANEPVDKGAVSAADVVFETDGCASGFGSTDVTTSVVIGKMLEVSDDDDHSVTAIEVVSEF